MVLIFWPVVSWVDVSVTGAWFSVADDGGLGTIEEQLCGSG